MIAPAMRSRSMRSSGLRFEANLRNHVERSFGRNEQIAENAVRKSAPIRQALLEGYRTASHSTMANEEGGILSSKALSSQVRCVNRSRSRPRCLDSMNRTSSSRHAKISQHPPPRPAVRASIRRNSDFAGGGNLTDFSGLRQNARPPQFFTQAPAHPSLSSNRSRMNSAHKLKVGLCVREEGTVACRERAVPSKGMDFMRQAEPGGSPAGLGHCDLTSTRAPCSRSSCKTSGSCLPSVF